MLSAEDIMANTITTGFAKKSLLDYAASQRASFEKTLSELVEIPSVSVDPRHQTDVSEVVSRAADLMRRHRRRGARARHRRASDAPWPLRAKLGLSNGHGL